MTYAIFNVDSLAIGATLPSSSKSDTLFIWDHPYGKRTGTVAVFDTIPLNAIAAAVAGGSDAEAVLRLDISTLPLTDTTFTAASGNRNWVAFGEGHRDRRGSRHHGRRLRRAGSELLLAARHDLRPDGQRV